MLGPSLGAQSTARATANDIVILHGRVIDPETRLNAVRNIAVRAGRVVAVTSQSISGQDTIDARGLIVAPGFDAWYAARAGRAAVNHGVAIGHVNIRGLVFGDTAAFRGKAPSGRALREGANDSQMEAIRRGLERGLEQGALGVGLLLGYTPGARPWEVIQAFRAAAKHRAAVYVHVRELEEPLWYLELSEVIAAAASTGAPAHVVHVNSSFQEEAPRALDFLRGARAHGVDVSTEAYPYAEAMTEIESALFDDWNSWPDAKFSRYEWPVTGERLSRATFERYRAVGGNVIIHPKDSIAAERWVRAALADTLTMIASDGVLENGVGHPRAVGTHARVLGRYVRDERVMPLMDAIRRMTLAPARRLEARVPAMRQKGRVQVGADADLVIFDLATVRDRGTFGQPALPPSGITAVVIDGKVVVRGSVLVRVNAGRPVRAPRTS
jgi:dihydroorotase